MTTREIDELYQQVYAHPDNDDIRRVLADALLAIEDPRGELIQYQFNPNADYQSRVMRLIQRYGLTWTGALRGYVIPLTYERGFLASCQVLDDVGQTTGREEWSTVHTVELDHDTRATPDFLAHPVMRSLRRITHASSEVLEWLPGQAAALPRSGLAVHTSSPWRVVKPLFGALSAMPQLQRLELPNGNVARDATGQWVIPFAEDVETEEPAAANVDDDDDGEARFDAVDE